MEIFVKEKDEKINVTRSVKFNLRVCTWVCCVYNLKYLFLYNEDLISVES